MVRVLMRIMAVTMLAGSLAFPAFAAPPPKTVLRPPNTARTLEQLAETLGSMHYLTMVCDGRQSQYWRQRMVELLKLENPDPWLMDRLTAAFNYGYRTQRAYYPVCNPQVEAQKERKSRQGHFLSSALADPYLH